MLGLRHIGSHIFIRRLVTNTDSMPMTNEIRSIRKGIFSSRLNIQFLEKGTETYRLVEKCDGVHGLKHHFDVMGTNDAALAATANTHRGKLKKT